MAAEYKKSHQDQLHQNNQIKTNKQYEGEIKRTKLPAEFPPLCFAEFPMLQATKATPPTVYE